MRQKITQFVESNIFQRIIVVLIIINAIIIGLETWPWYMITFGHLTDEVDLVILGIFIVEILLKLIAYGWRFFASPWNIFDSAIVIISVLPAAGSLAVFRALRIIRTLRLLKNISKLRLIIESLLHSIPSIGWIALLLSLIFYIYAVVGVNLFGTDFPEYFGSFTSALFSLFQIMTLESWSSGIARPILALYPLASIYFVTFILIATYTTLNIFIAIVVNTMNERHREEIEKEEQHIKEYISQENQELKNELRQLKEEILSIKKLLK